VEIKRHIVPGALCSIPKKDAELFGYPTHRTVERVLHPVMCAIMPVQHLYSQIAG